MLCAIANHRGSANASAAPFIASRSRYEPCSSTIRRRRWMRISGMLILTGQTSYQAPHRDEAYGKDCE